MDKQADRWTDGPERFHMMLAVRLMLCIQQNFKKLSTTAKLSDSSSFTFFFHLLKMQAFNLKTYLLFSKSHSIKTYYQLDQYYVL